MTIQDQITAAAQAKGVDPNIALKVAQTESGFNQSAVSSAGAIQGGIQYLAQMYAQFGDWSKALAAYNWGPGNVATYGDSWADHAPTETVNYVSGILGGVGVSIGNAGSSVVNAIEGIFSPSTDSTGVTQSQDLILAAGVVLLVALLFWSI